MRFEIRFDFYELEDDALSKEDYSEHLSSASFVGSLDQDEMSALKDFFASCAELGLETENRYVFKIESYLLPKVYTRLMAHPMPPQ